MTSLVTSWRVERKEERDYRMFLKYVNANLPYVATPSKFTAPTSINHVVAFALPTKSLGGMAQSDKQLGAKDIAGYLEAINYRKNDAKTITKEMLENIVDKAHELDLAMQESDSGFIASDENYVTLLNALKATSQLKIIPGTPNATTDLQCLKWFIHKHGAAIVETHLANSFLAENASGVFDVSSVGSNTPIVRKDYSKAFVAFGYDSTGLIVQNTLGLSWGSLGFARISWNCLNSTVTLPDGQSTKCFIAGWILNGAFN